VGNNSKAGEGGTMIRGDDGSECGYGADGNLIPGLGTFNYGGGNNPWNLLTSGFWKHMYMDVFPSFMYDDRGNNYQGGGGSSPSYGNGFPFPIY
jgi:hypothetical protein